MGKEASARIGAGLPVFVLSGHDPDAAQTLGFRAKRAATSRFRATRRANRVRGAYGTARTVSHVAGVSLPARVIRRFRLLIVGSYAVM
jgi:hypothetical protein